jgi:hypothetical protein
VIQPFPKSQLLGWAKFSEEELVLKIVTIEVTLVNFEFRGPLKFRNSGEIATESLDSSSSSAGCSSEVLRYIIVSQYIRIRILRANFPKLLLARFKLYKLLETPFQMDVT